MPASRVLYGAALPTFPAGSGGGAGVEEYSDVSLYVDMSRASGGSGTINDPFGSLNDAVSALEALLPTLAPSGFTGRRASIEIVDAGTGVTQSLVSNGLVAQDTAGLTLVIRSHATLTALGKVDVTLANDASTQGCVFSLELHHIFVASTTALSGRAYLQLWLSDGVFIGDVTVDSLSVLADSDPVHSSLMVLNRCRFGGNVLARYGTYPPAMASSPHQNLFVQARGCEFYGEVTTSYGAFSDCFFKSNIYLDRVTETGDTRPLDGLSPATAVLQNVPDGFSTPVYFGIPGIDIPQGFWRCSFQEGIYLESFSSLYPLVVLCDTATLVAAQISALQTAYVRLYAHSPCDSDLYGDGSDGDVVIGVPTVLSRDMYYRTLSVNEKLTTAGYKVFVQNQLYIGSGGTIEANAQGQDEGGNVYFLLGERGGEGGVIGAEGGTAQQAVPLLNAYKSFESGAGGNANDLGGAASTPTNAAGSWRANGWVVATDSQIHASMAGTGGGGGGSGLAAAGGYGGGGGGGLYVAAREVDVKSGRFFEAKGGDGGPGVTAANPAESGAGGGGGSGGFVFILTDFFYPDPASCIDVSGGAGGASGGAPAEDGNPGNPGDYIVIRRREYPGV